MSETNKSIICRYKGGSHSYGLTTPESDVDWRGVFLHADIEHIIGLKSGGHDCESKHTDSEDSQYWELRKFLNMVKAGNTQAIEMLYLDRSEYELTSFPFLEIIDNRERLFDSDRMFKTLLGYAQSERMLANGERTGAIGSKRKAALEKYGYSPKNAVQFFRLMWCGETLYRYGFFPVNVAKYDPKVAKDLMRIKTSPGDFKIDEINTWFDEAEALMRYAFEKTEVHFKFDNELANRICSVAYLLVLNNLNAGRFE